MKVHSLLGALGFGVTTVIPMSVNAQSSTFDFTGVVTSAQGMYSSIGVGTAVTGTYTIDYAAAIPALSTGTPGAPSPGWRSLSGGGTAFSPPGYPTPTALVFSSTAQVGDFFYSTRTPDPWYTNSYVQGGGTFLGFEQIDSGTVLSYGDSYLNLITNNASPPYTSNGLPVFEGVGTGYFQTVSAISNGAVYYNITGLTAAVPEPGTFALMLAGLGLIGCVAGRRMSV